MILVIFRVSQLFRKKRFRNQSVSSSVVYICIPINPCEFPNQMHGIFEGVKLWLMCIIIMMDTFHMNNVYRKYLSIILDNSWSITVIMNFSVNNLQWEKKSHLAKIKQKPLDNSSEKHRVGLIRIVEGCNV